MIEPDLTHVILNDDEDSDEDSFIEILKSWFGHAEGPTDDTEQGSGGVWKLSSSKLQNRIHLRCRAPV